MPSLNSSQHALLTCSEHASLAFHLLYLPLFIERVVEATVVVVAVVEVGLVVVAWQVKTDSDRRSHCTSHLLTHCTYELVTECRYEVASESKVDGGKGE